MPDAGSIRAGATPAAPDKVEEHWAYVKPSRPRLPPVKSTGLGPQSDRPVRSGAAGKGGARTLRRSAEGDAAAARDARPHRPAADAGRGRRVRRRHRARTPTSGVVDRLLASPHYGERWARPWLDLARYADTNGYEKDNRRTMWKYRDWVIDALNRDMPFDQFTIEQIAGDMLPDATRDQQIATGFHRNTMINEEGGVDPEESRYEALRRPRQHDRHGLARARRSAARSATTTSTTRSARRTTTGCSRSSTTRRTRPDDRRRHALLRADAGARERRSRRAHADAAGRDRPRSSASSKAITPASAARAGEWERSIRAGGARWTPWSRRA